MEHPKSDKLPVFTRRPGKALRSRLHATRFAPSDLSVGNPHRRRNLVTLFGLSNRSSGEASGKIFPAVSEMLILSPGDVAELRAGQLRGLSGNRDSNRFLGQFCRAFRASGDVKVLIGGGNPSIPVPQGWGAAKLADGVSADAAAASDFGRTHASELWLSTEARDYSGPTTKLRKMAANATSIEQMSQFVQAGA